jgi:hypothetical protein
MPILVMALAALAVFLVIGGLLFAAGVSERRKPSGESERPVSPKRAA